MKKLPISLQMWSLRDDQAKDFAATVAAVAKIGYSGVELAGTGNLDAKGAKAALDAAGLKVSGMHVGIDRLRTGIGGVISDALLFGTKHIICPWWPKEMFLSSAACEEIGVELGEIGSRLRAFGLQLSFHNHDGELKLIGGRTVFDWLLSAAAPRDLTAEVDVYWVHRGGQSPGKLLRDFGSRCVLVHLKDEKELGLGPVNFEEVFAAIDSIGSVEWLVVEQEAYNHAPLESVRLCFEQLKRWGRA